MLERYILYILNPVGGDLVTEYLCQDSELLVCGDYTEFWGRWFFRGRGSRAFMLNDTLVV